MTITREQAIALGKKHLLASLKRNYAPFTKEELETANPPEWAIAAIIEASQPIADVQAEGSEREAFEAWFGASIHDRLSRNMPDKSYNDPSAFMMWKAWQAATVAHRQQQAAAKGGE